MKLGAHEVAALTLRERHGATDVVLVLPPVMEQSIGVRMFLAPEPYREPADVRALQRFDVREIDGAPTMDGYRFTSVPPGRYRLVCGYAEGIRREAAYWSLAVVVDAVPEQRIVLSSIPQIRRLEFGDLR